MILRARYEEPRGSFAARPVELVSDRMLAVVPFGYLELPCGIAEKGVGRLDPALVDFLQELDREALAREEFAYLLFLW